MRQLYIYSLIIGTQLVSSCEFTHETATLKPEVKATTSDIGKGRVVKFKTVDVRTSSVVGSRGYEGGMSSDIVVYTKDAIAIVQTTLVDGLKQKGFKPNLEEGSAQHGLRVEIRQLEYSLKPAIIVNRLRTEAALKATCTVEGKEAYDKIYRGEEKDSVLFPQFAGENERYINSALSKAIQNLLDDPELQQCLAQ